MRDTTPDRFVFDAFGRSLSWAAPTLITSGVPLQANRRDIGLKPEHDVDCLLQARGAVGPSQTVLRDV